MNPIQLVNNGFIFLRCHPELANVKPRAIDSVRVKDTSPEHLAKWFNDPEMVINEYKIISENMYNMNESSFSNGKIQPGKYIINAQIQQQFQTKPRCQEWVTSVEYICTDGTALLPLIIFKAEIYHGNGYQ